MTNTRTIAGAALVALMQVTLTFAAFEPVEAATTCPAANAMVGKVCTNLATGALSTDCKPSLA